MKRNILRNGWYGMIVLPYWVRLSASILFLKKSSLRWGISVQIFTPARKEPAKRSLSKISWKTPIMIIWVRSLPMHRGKCRGRHLDCKAGSWWTSPDCWMAQSAGIELWKIDDSSPAPKFNVVESPNDWAKEIKASESMSETKQFSWTFEKSSINMPLCMKFSEGCYLSGKNNLNTDTIYE